jgi:3(or 17)beta-hydroxysteroid dehydrogenase
MNRVDGKVAIVTGAGGGIGRATAELLVDCGAKVVVTDVDDEALAATVERIKLKGADVISLRHDVANDDDWRQAISAAIDVFGGFEILVNNAGIFLQKSIEETVFEEYERVMRVNVWGVMQGTKYAIQSMKERIGESHQAGTIVNVASVAAIKGSPFGSIYSASKGAVRSFTRSMAREVAALKYNIRVNAIYPGIIDTTMGAAAMKRIADSAGESNNRGRELAEDMHLIRRIGDPLDIAKGIVYLASEDAAFVTGTELVVDGGFSVK